MKESDWKTFRRIIPELRETYLERVNKEIVDLLETKSSSETERFWNAEETTETEVRILQECFDDLRRSRLSERVGYMLKHGVLPKDRLNEFSDEFRTHMLALLDL